MEDVIEPLSEGQKEEANPAFNNLHPTMPEHPKDATRVAAGLKASINNPNVSQEAKERAIQKLKEMSQDREAEPAAAHAVEFPSEDQTRVKAGYKATLSNPNTSQQAKAHAKEVLEAAGIREKHPDHSEEEHRTRVQAGYKAALRNPRVSEEAKQHAREYLAEHGVEVDEGHEVRSRTQD